jgi:hypothetical protein
MGEVAYTLLHPTKPNPSAFEALVEEADPKKAFAYVSRDFLLRIGAANKGDNS